MNAGQRNDGTEPEFWNGALEIGILYRGTMEQSKFWSGRLELRVSDRGTVEWNRNQERH